MTPRQPLDLTDQQRQELRATLNHHAKPYMRERAGAPAQDRRWRPLRMPWRGKACCGHAKRIRSTPG